MKPQFLLSSPEKWRPGWSLSLSSKHGAVSGCEYMGTLASSDSQLFIADICVLALQVIVTFNYRTWPAETACHCHWGLNSEVICKIQIKSGHQFDPTHARDVGCIQDSESQENRKTLHKSWIIYLFFVTFLPHSSTHWLNFTKANPW